MYSRSSNINIKDFTIEKNYALSKRSSFYFHSDNSTDLQIIMKEENKILKLINDQILKGNSARLIDSAKGTFYCLLLIHINSCSFYFDI